MRQEQVAHAAHLERVLAQFGHEVQKVEELQKNAMAAVTAAATASAQLVTTPQSTMTVGGNGSTKISKPPTLPHFSGADPVLKDEGSYEQWRFQVNRALKV